jgi:hypothetical protein
MHTLAFRLGQLSGRGLDQEGYNEQKEEDEDEDEEEQDSLFWHVEVIRGKTNLQLPKSYARVLLMKARQAPWC